VINRVFYWLRRFRETQGKTYETDVKKLLLTLDIGSHINARPEPRLEAGAQRTLEGVGSRPWFGADAARKYRHRRAPASVFRRPAGIGCHALPSP
jgi:hypothetical protein